MDDYTILLDAPGEARKRIQIAKLGDDFQHGKYGQFAITKDDVATWQKNLSQLPGGRALIDADHQADRTPRNTEASGWITGVSLDGDTPMADVEWTPKGKQAIEESRYLFISPTYGPFKDEHGVTHENTLLGAALTNRPFLNMPAITLASDERVSAALDQDPAARFYARALDGDLGDEAHAMVMLDVDADERKLALKEGNSLPDGSYPIRNTAQLHAAAILAASGHGDAAAAKKLIQRRAKELGVDITTLPGFAAPAKKLDASDSRGPDMETALLIKQLGLADDADDKVILDALTELQEQATKPEPPTVVEPKTLEQQATDAGKRLLDTDTLVTLERQAAAGEAAMKQLHEQRFETAFDKALTDPKGARVTVAEKDQLHKVFLLDADLAIEMIDKREPVVHALPVGPPAIELDQNGNADPDQLVAAGVHPDNATLDTAIRKHMLDNKIPESQYAKVLEQYVGGAITL